MARILTLLIIALIAESSFGQIGIGTEAPLSSAELEIASSNRGVLLPRLELKNTKDKETISGDLVDSLLIYHTGNSQLAAGFYYWYQDGWLKVNAGDITEILTSLEVVMIDQEENDIEGNQIKVQAPLLVYYDEHKQENEVVNLRSTIQTHETKTLLKPEKYNVVEYTVIYEDGKASIIYVTEGEPAPDIPEANVMPTGEIQERTKYNYYNEQGEITSINASDFITPDIETLTTLNFDSNSKSLIYHDEHGNDNSISLEDLVATGETPTYLRLERENNGDSYLNYTNEEGVQMKIRTDDIARQPWFAIDTRRGATDNKQDIFIDGWVGIGFNQKSTAPNEMLRVNGSISATNSYYADYVFENYFEGYSTLKDDYKFNDLNTVNEFIKKNRHLPGITPITELEKGNEGYSFNVSELSIQLLEKIEELYLHLIEQQKILNDNELKIEKLEIIIEKLLNEQFK